MARVAGVNLPLNKRAEIGLTYVHGIGRSTANQILEQVGVDPDTYVKDLTEEETVKLREAVEALEVEGDLRRGARRTSSGSRRSARTAACATGAACRRADSARRPTPAAARARGA